MEKKPKKDPEEVLSEPIETVSQETSVVDNQVDNSLSPEKVEPTDTATVQPDLESELSWEEKIKDIEYRKTEFRKELEASVEKWLIAPDTKIVRTNHGDKVGIVFIDLKFSENIDEVFPSWEDEKAMGEILQKAIVSKGE